ncbi:hypothetical protein AABB24_003348 [Solanum stoloniferum]|uniref:Uncharacterized protein n=1 Tax=Solanum stoloniferum TaxID=62892 RepID=A0ABD2V6V1_9SOLN
MYMGNIKKKNLLLIFFFFFYLSCTCSKEFQYSKNLGSEAPSSPHDHEMIKNGEGGGLMTTNTKKMKTRTLKLKNRSSSENWNRKRTYTAMLPKGYVPPSGSSPCHNTYPNSVTFFCHFSTRPNNKLP